MTAEENNGHSHSSGWWSRYVFSTDHKVIGIQYAVTALCFLLIGFSLMLMMRWQLAHSEDPLPFLGKFISEDNLFMPGGVMVPEFYNALGAMHGTIMVFLAVVPLLVGAFGNYLVPLQIGAPD
ncbi:MAG: cbb3-type cytochrome c oxidase subunit I, partial [Candidatus Hydrogenedentes bacterium]|nr:cbb3-type cytochrome c oxidase subunit I [Candidatus Hydrogenedentota bacterium]